MKIIGITGGFSTGKSTVSQYLKKLGARLIDSDRVVHHLYRRDKAVKRAVVKAFGRGILTRGEIDRRKLAQTAFSSKRAIRSLCRIIHKPAIKKIKRDAIKSKNDFVVIEAPLLIEAGLDKFVDYVVVVTSSREKQLVRARSRGFTGRDVIARRGAQMSLRKKAGRADFVIKNDGSKKIVKKEVSELWRKLKEA